MPNRVIKESIKRSPQIDALTWFEEVVYYRLMVTADDYGCMDGRTILLKNELFPLKDSVTKKAVEDAISKLVSVGLLCKYTANDMPYLFFPTWEKHQRLRNKHRKYPNPAECGVNVDCQSNDGQMTASCQSEIESEIEKEKEYFSPEPQSAAVLMMPLVDKTEYEIFQKDIDEWQEAYPAVDVLQQLKAMRVWCNDNPKNKKTRNGVRRFINGWLDREQNKSRRVQAAPQTDYKPTRTQAVTYKDGPDYLPDWAEGS